MKKKILSLFLALAMCLSLLPTAAFAADGAQDPAEPGEEILAPEQLGDPEKDPDPEQEEQQADPSVKQDEVVAAVQALMDALPGEVTADNADELQAKLMAIDAALEALSDEQLAQFLTRYEAVCEALSSLTAVQAETTSGHTGDHGEYTLPEGKTWTGINNITAEMDAGYYYLTDYVTISSTWKPKDGVVLCLNGYGITLDADGPAIQVQPGVTFTLCDCSSRGEGSIRHSGGNNEKYGVGVLVGALDNLDKTAEFNMYGGTISYNTSISDGKVEGGGVTVAGGTFNMYGGTISDNKSLSGKGIGGGVFIANHGTFNMSGGEITQNGAKIGGGVFVGGYYGANTTEKENDANYGGTFHMSGGSITGNTAGGGVYVNYYPTTFTVSGTAQITGNRYAGETRNVYLSKGTIGSNVTYANPIEVGTLASSASIGVTTAKVGQTVATGVSRAAKGCFTPDNSSKYRLQYDNDVQTLTMIAATHENHPICGASCTHNGAHTGESWTPISDLSEIKGNGNYYLTDNVKLTASWTSGSYNGKNVKLCLNGFDIIANVDDSAIKLSTYDGNTLTLCDCVGSGEITHGVKADGSKYTGAGVEVPGTQTFNMYGGTITGNKNTFGGGVLLGNGSTFNMHGGSITGNKADANSTSTSDGLGGGVCAKGVSGGAKITFNMYGGTIEDNTATNRGGGVYVGNDAQFSMSGGSITGNTAAQGGGVYYVASNSLYVSGNVNITGNKGTDGKANNVYVPSSSGTPKTVPFYIAWYVLNEDARIGVRVDDNLIATGEHSPVAQVSVYGDKTNAYHEGNFIPDNGGNYGFKMEESEHDTLTPNVVNLYNGLPHKHAICGKTAEKCTDRHSDEVWTPLTSVNGKPYAGGTALETGNFNATEGYKLPAGHYYLSTELTLDKPLLIKKGVSLCLNGKTLTVSSNNSAVIIDTNCDLTLCDCSEEQTGTITHAASATGRGVYMGSSDGNANSYNGSFTMYGGSITGNHIAANSGAGVYMRYGMFNMHGGSITGNTTAENHGTGGVYVSGGEFNMTGGRITDTGGGVRVDNKGMFNMSGDAVISNNDAYSGGGVYVYAATFNMSGNASVSGNTASYGGVYVGAGTASAAAKFNMSGNASISGNIANYGGGVYVYGSSSFTMSEKAAITGNNVNNDGGGVYVNGYTATMTVSGDVQIKDNWQDGSKNDKTGVYEKGDDSSANNFYLFGEDETKQQTITIGGVLETTARIGVTTCLTPTASNPIKIATGATGAQIHYARVFTPDVTGRGYTITLPVGGQNLYLSTHQHVWSYTAEGATITATCTDTTCTSKNGGSVTIVAPDKNTLTYDGKTKEAMLEGALTTGVTLTAKDIKYYHKIGEQEYLLETGAKPTNAKSYRAEITVGGVNASVDYEIKKATPTADDFTFTPPTSLTYDSSPKTATVTSTKIDASYVTVKYYQGETKVSDPTNAGTYTVKIDVTESGNYFAASGLNANDWMFAIAKNTDKPTVTLDPYYSLTYKQSQLTPPVTVTINGKSLTENVDYTVTYGKNIDAGELAGSVTINPMGNYEFRQIVRSFTIDARYIAVTASDKTSRVGQNLVALTYTCTKGLPYEGDTFTGELATNANKNTAGTYQITQGTLSLGNNYNIAFTPGTYTVEDKQPQTGFKFENAEVTKIYGNEDFIIEAIGAKDGSDVIYSCDPQYAAVATVDSNGKVTINGAGQTTITATASATDDYAEATAEYTLTVSPKTLTADDLEFTANSTFTKEYDGTTNCTTATVQINSDAKVNNGDALPTVTGTYAYNSKDAKGATKVTFTTERTENTNYILPAGLTVEHKASITQRVLTVGTVTATSKQYDGETDAEACIASVPLNGVVNGDSLELDTPTTDGSYYFTADFIDANAGQNKTITGTVWLATGGVTANYTFKDAQGNEANEATFTTTGAIAKADSWALTPVTDLTIRYNNRAEQTYTPDWPKLLPAGQKWTYNLEDTKVTGSAVLADHSIGADSGVLTYQLSAGAENDTVTWTITASCNNYESFTLTVKLTLIARNEQTGFAFKDVVDGKVTKTYGDADFTVKATGANEYSEVTYESSDENVAKVNAQTGEVTIVGAGTAEITAAAAETDVYASASASYTLTVNKLRIPVPTKGTNELEYTGQEQTYLPDGLDPIYCTIKSNTATDVIAGGSWHNADVSLKDRSNTEWADGADSTAHRPYPFRITPKPVTVTALDKKITAGQPAPELTSADYTVTGLIGNDTLGGISLYYADPSDLSKVMTPDTGKAGTYAIVVTKGGTGSNNYAPTFVNGTLTIASRPSGGVVAVTYPVNVPGETERGSVSSNVKNASKGSTVTITVEPEDGFQLADLTVTDKDGNELPLTDKGDGKYTFTMPAGKVEVNATFAEKIETSPFADVSTDAYYYEAVKWAAEQGITGGVGGGLFAPDQSCTRAQIVTFLWRAAGSPEPKSMSSFSDVPEDSYYAKAVAWAVENGITVGTSATTFSPDATCTRAQGVTFLFRAAKASADGAPAFRDVAADAYYAAAVKWATDNSVTNGIGGGLFGSDNDCARAQIVTFLWRLYAGK